MNNLYTNQEATMMTEFGNTLWFKIRKGIRQGSVSSPYRFNFYTESITGKAGIETIQGIKIGEKAGLETIQGIKIGGRMINNLRHADETTLISGNLDD